MPSAAVPSAPLPLVRHGHVADNTAGPGARLCGWTDAPRSPRGRAEVKRLRERPATAQASDAVYSSPLRRARETAEAVAAPLGLRPRRRPGLREIGCGALDRRLLTDVRCRFPARWAANARQDDAGFRWPGGESYRAFRRRVPRALGAIAAAPPAGGCWWWPTPG